MAKTTKAPGSGKAIKIARDLRIAGARPTFDALHSAARGSEARVLLDGTQVEKTDAAGLQALLSGRQALVSAGKSVGWTGCSAQLRAAAGLLGLTEALELPQ